MKLLTGTFPKDRTSYLLRDSNMYTAFSTCSNTYEHAHRRQHCVLKFFANNSESALRQIFHRTVYIYAQKQIKTSDPEKSLLHIHMCGLY